jgi:hypothetical protein
VFSSHNLASRDSALGPAEVSELVASGGRMARVADVARKAADHNVGWLVHRVASAPRRVANRRRLGPLQYRAQDHAIVNDDAHDFGLLHYYIGSVAQERQLAALGYRLLEVLEFSGPTVPLGQEGRGGSLYYVATPAK